MGGMCSLIACAKYETPRMLRIHSTRLFAVDTVCKIAVFVYGIVYTIILEKGYSKSSLITSASTSFFSPTMYDPGNTAPGIAFDIFSLHNYRAFQSVCRLWRRPYGN